MSLVESEPLVSEVPTTCNSLLSKQRCQLGDKDYIDVTEIVLGSSSSKHGEEDCCSVTSDYVTGNQTTSQEIEQATKSCILLNNPPDVSGDHKRDALNNPPEEADSNFSETAAHIGVNGEIAKNSISGQTALHSFSKSRGPSGVCGSQPSPADVVSCEQESTSRERGYGMLVPGFGLVLPRNTLISFCPHQSETFRDRLLKTRARDTAGSQGTCTRQDRPQPQLATPQQATQIVQKKSINSTVDDPRQPGKIVRSTDYSLFPVNLVLPVPSKEALQDNIGKGGNGIVTYIYHKRREFAVKKTHFRLGEVDILCKLDHKNIVKLIAVMMGEEDPLRPHRYYCYHFYPRMSGDVQTYLNRLGQGALSNVLMKHKDSPSMLQLVVDNAKHILRSVLKGIHYLHSNDVVHSDIKPSNVLVNLSTGCKCTSPVECSCQQLFDVVLTDFDSAIDVRDPEKNKKKWSVVGTAGYRTPERYLQSPEFNDTKPSEWKMGDIWSFGALVLKMFLSHCGPSSQRQIAFLYLWRYASFPWNVEDKLADNVLQQNLIRSVYPNWPQLWQLAGDCMKISPLERPSAVELTNHPFFSS